MLSVSSWDSMEVLPIIWFVDREEPERSDSSELEREDRRRLRASLGDSDSDLLLLLPEDWAIAVKSADAEVGMPFGVIRALDAFDLGISHHTI